MTERAELEKAIAPWWPVSRGGATARRILDILEREGATTQEAFIVGKDLASAASRLSVIAESIILTSLEKAHAQTSTHPTVAAEAVFDSFRCVFGSGVVCPQCSEANGEPWVHGELLSPSEMLELIADLRTTLGLLGSTEAKWASDGQA